MKTQLAKPARTKASYSDQYKQEALELWRSSGRSAAKVAAELGIRAPLLYRWAHLEREPKAVAAIPAVIAFNRFADQVGRLEVRYAAFTEEFSSILQRHAGRKHAGEA